MPPARSVRLRGLLDSWRLLARTGRYLRPQDFRWRLASGVKRLAHESIPAPWLRRAYGIEIDPHRADSVSAVPAGVPLAHRRFDVESILSHRFCFLNLPQRLPARIDWNPSGLPKLWLYNLHYFDYLPDLAVQGGPGCAKAIELVRSWIEDNPIGRGHGWEPYPLSLRIVNWLRFLKWTGSRVSRTDAALIHDSLAAQASFLAANLEPSGYSNHALKSRKALVFAAGAGDGSGQTYAARFCDELSRQILSDGGHNERSPMYHLLALEDALDVFALLQAAPRATPPLRRLQSHLGECIGKMLHFALSLRHPDGTLPAFNDCSQEVAPPASALQEYARALGLSGQLALSRAAFPVSGYYVVTHPRRTSRVLVDAGPLGPDHNPGHAHCDALSYELSVGSRAWVVNSGTFGYDRGTWREFFRGTSAHSTASVDGGEQAELWASFRAATRLSCRVATASPAAWTGSHDGFRRHAGDCVHTRRVSATGTGWSIHDRITGYGKHTVRSFVHFHPDVEVHAAGGRRFELRRGTERVHLHVAAGVTVTLDAGSLEPPQGWYAPEFGKRVPRSTLTLTRTGECPLEVTYTFELGAT